MAKPVVTAADIKARIKRRDEWCQFRSRYLFSQRNLAEVLNVSVRTIQNIEADAFTSFSGTLSRFRALKARLFCATITKWEPRKWIPGQIKKSLLPDALKPCAGKLFITIVLGPLDWRLPTDGE